MKTAISVPDELFRAADRLAGRRRVSRSGLYCEALAAYLAQHDESAVAQALDAYFARPGSTGAADPFVRRAARRTLRDSTW